MTREIKFRAWDKKNKEWCEPRMFAIASDGHIAILRFENPLFWAGMVVEKGYEKISDERQKEIVLMQDTGLLDKNGKEIYEGDIIRGYKKNGKEKIAPVVFYHGHFMLTKTDTNKKWRSLGTIKNKDIIEVIGNVWENPNLL